VLESVPETQLPLTYQQLADALELVPPRTIQRVAQALETLMHEDAKAGRPLIAALVVSRYGEGLPAPGFFELAVALRRFPAEPAAQVSAYRDEFQRALEARG
jgi:hypothetical protein